MKRHKFYNKTAQLYKEKVEKLGYCLKFNWIDPYGGEYEDVTVRGPKFRGYGTEYSTPRDAYEHLK